MANVFDQFDATTPAQSPAVASNVFDQFDAPQAQDASIPQEIGRALLRTGRSVLAGPAGILDVINAPLDAVLGMAGSDFRFGSPSQTIRQGFDTATQGTPYSTAPRNNTERVIDTATEFVSGAAPFKLAQGIAKAPQAIEALSKLAPQTAPELASYAGAGAGSEVAHQIAPDSPAAPFIGALAGGKLTNMAMDAPAAIERGAQNIKQGITSRTGAELAKEGQAMKDSAVALKDAAQLSKINLNPDESTALMGHINDGLNGTEIIPEFSPITNKVVQLIQQNGDAGTLNLNQLDQYRRMLGKAHAEDSVAAGAVRRAIDKTVNNLSTEGRDANSIDLLNQFRKDYTQSAKFNKVAEIVANGQNDPNFVKRGLTKLLQNKDETRGWSDEEKAALARAANLGNTNAILKIIGKFGFDAARLGSGAGGLIAGGVGYGVGGATGAAALPIAGTAAKQLYKTATQGQTENLLKTIQGNAPKQYIPDVAGVPLKTRAMQAAIPSVALGLQNVQTPPVTLPGASRPSTMDVAPLPTSAAPSAPVQPMPAMPQNTSKFPSIEQKQPDAQIKPQSSIESTIQTAAQQTGVDPDLLHGIAKVESTMNPNAKADTSTAAGLFQITHKTWRGLVAKYGQQNGFQMKDIMDPQANSMAASLLTKENIGSLTKKLGREPSAEEIYFAHVLNPNQATKLINADPRQNAALLLPAEAYANKNVFYYKDGKPRDVYAVRQLLGDKINKAMSGIQQQRTHVQQQQAQADQQKQKDAVLQAMLSKIPPESVQALRGNPSLAGDFNQMYGDGASSLFLNS